MKQLFTLVLIMIFSGSLAVAKDAIYQHPAQISKLKTPQYSQASCKFSQIKTIPNSDAYIKSGGNFKFDITNGVIFETLYPVKSTTAYTSEQSKRISDIIIAISKKNYSYINRNFEVYYLNSSGTWQIALKPKKDSKISNVMASIVIHGSKYIDKIEINTLKSGSTKINFTECK